MDNRWGLASRSAREASLPPKKTVNDFAAKMGSAALREARQPKDSDEFKLGQPTAVEVPDFIAAASLKDVKRSALPDPAAAFQPSQSDSVSRGRGDGGPGRRGRSVGRAKPNTEAHAKSTASAFRPPLSGWKPLFLPMILLFCLMISRSSRGEVGNDEFTR
jgi:hypothetical protein